LLNLAAPVQSLDQLDPFDHAFVDALLHLGGVDGPPALEEFRVALDELARYYSALELAPPSSTALDDAWLEGQSMDVAGAQLAYLFHRFGVLYRSQATTAQLSAFQQWWTTGDVSLGYGAACPTCF
jgi:hypothetical protein